MLNTKDKTEARMLAIKTRDILISSFGKSVAESEKMINSFGMEAFIIKHPMALHESAYDWALRLLTKNEDYEALRKSVG